MADEPEGSFNRLAHDIRSPLAVVEMLAALLERDTGGLTPEQRADYARRIRKAAADIRDVLDR